MSQATVIDRTRAEPDISSVSLYDLLHNSLVLANVLPYLPPSAAVNLAAVNHAFRALINGPGAFRHLDLTRVKKVQFHSAETRSPVWRDAHLDDTLTEEHFYSRQLRNVFSTLQHRGFLQNVQTLVLDGLSVTSELCHEIINSDSFSVRILSIRDVNNLNQGKLRGALQYACRRSRPENSPRLKALYVFGPRDLVDWPNSSAAAPGADLHRLASLSADWNHKSQAALTSSLRREGDAWWSKRGRIISRPISEEWAGCMAACEGIIAFDAVLCQGPRHRNSPVFGKTSLPVDSGPAVATYAVSGCEGCGAAPEGLVHPTSRSPASLPLLTPPPILSSSVRAATSPQHPYQPFAPRCMDCLRERYCTGCHKWWCEACYKLPSWGPVADISNGVVVVDDDQDAISPGPDSLEMLPTAVKFKSQISKSCWECGNNCDSCIDRTQRVCRKCCGGYCIIHNEGSSASHCDWCVSRGRGLGRL